MSWFKRAWAALSHGSTAWGLLPSNAATYVGTLVWGAVMAVAGYAEGIPWMWVMMAIPLAVAGIYTALSRRADWELRNAPENKLVFGGIQLGNDPIKDDATSKTVGIMKAQVNLILSNLATFPLSYKVEEIFTSFEGRIASEKKYDNRGGVIPLGGVQFFHDPVINLGHMAIKPQVTGTAKFVIKYGRAGNERHELRKNIRFMAVFDTNIGAYVSGNWIDLVE